MERIGYIILITVAILWLALVIYGMVEAFPFGIIGILAIAGIGVLLIKVVQDKAKNKEDKHYSDTVGK